MCSYPQESRKTIFVPTEGAEFLFTHPSPSSLASRPPLKDPGSSTCRQRPSAYKFSGGKYLHLPVSNLEYLNYQALLSKYNFINYSKFGEFKEKFPQEDQAKFQVLIDESKLMARTSLQDTVCCSQHGIKTNGKFTSGKLWLHTLGVPRYVQNTVEDLCFDKTSLFNEKMDESLRLLKDFRAVLPSLYIHTSPVKKIS